MAAIPIGTRIDSDMFQAFEEEAKRRRQDKAELLRSFVRDGLTRNDAYSDQIIQMQLSILEHLKKLQEMIGAVLHLDVEQAVLALPQGVDELPETYKKRLMQEYRRGVFEALNKGARIAAAPASLSPSGKVRHDH